MLVPKRKKYLYSTVKQCHCLCLGKPGQGKQHGQVRRKAETKERKSSTRISISHQKHASFVFSQEEEFTASYGSAGLAAEEKDPLLPAGNPFCLTHSHPDANVKEERRHWEYSEGFYNWREALSLRTVMLKCWPAPCLVLAQL